MTQPSAPDIFAADQRSHWQSGHRGIWSLQGSNLDSIPTLSILTTLWDQPRWLEPGERWEASWGVRYTPAA